MSYILKEPNSRMEVLSYLDWILASPITPYDTHEAIIANVLLGNYDVLVGYHDDKPVSICVYKVQDRNCFVVLIYAVNNFTKFYDLFVQIMQDRSVKSITSITMHDAEVTSRLMKMQPLYTFMRRIL